VSVCVRWCRHCGVHLWCVGSYWCSVKKNCFFTYQVRFTMAKALGHSLLEAIGDKAGGCSNHTGVHGYWWCGLETTLCFARKAQVC
jgi:hypothetical protein